MVKVLLAVVLLFPWSLVAAGVLLLLRRRRPVAGLKVFTVHAYIPPAVNPPILLDSAQVVRRLRDLQQ